MTGIDLQWLTTPLVAIGHEAHTTDVLRELGRLQPEERMRAVIVVAEPEGEYRTFSYADLAQAISEDGEMIIDLPLEECLQHVESIASPFVDRTDMGIAEARDRQRTAPGRRLLVMSEGQLIGVLSDDTQGGPGFDLRGFDDRLFAVADAAPDIEWPEAPRWLSAQVHAEDRKRRRSFRRNAVNTVTVGIAPADEDLIQADVPFPHQVPEGEIHTMDVVFWAPELLDAPLWGSFDLPHAGPTVEPVQFDIDVPADLERLEATIAVVYQRRLVQAATLEGLVVAGADEAAPTDERIVLRRAPIAKLDPSFGRAFDAIVVTNGDEVLVSTADGSRQLSLGGVAESVTTIQNRLYAAAASEARAGGGLDAPAIRSLFRVLAYHGHAIFRALAREETASLSEARTIEVVSRRPGDSLPIELVYDRGAPGREPELCTKWQDAHATGAACVECDAVADPLHFVCPLGFWGLSKEIARRVSIDLDDDVLATVQPSEPLQGRSELPPLSGVLIGASTKVDAAGGPSQIDATVELAAQLMPDAAFSVSSWQDWVAAVTDHHPPLLLAMCHTELDRELEVEMLRIGEDSDLDPLAVGTEHVQSPVGEVGPIVLLLGCMTDAPRLGYLGFVPAFLDHHAAVVVGTIAKVLGRHTGPVARQFLQEAVDAQGMNQPLSEVMRRIRASMVAEGNVMGLTLTAYGDADWRLGA